MSTDVLINKEVQSASSSDSYDNADFIRLYHISIKPVAVVIIHPSI